MDVILVNRGAVGNKSTYKEWKGQPGYDGINIVVTGKSQACILYCSNFNNIIYIYDTLDRQWCRLLQ